jgi:N-acyl-D-aspartate/D-glutamate deacylase
LAHYARELGAITLPDAVAKMTGRSAAQLGLADRGVIAVGKKADITIFDPVAVQDRGVPGNAAQAPVGVAFVVVNGEVVLDNAAMTKARPGRGIKRANADAARE